MRFSRFTAVAALALTTLSCGGGSGASGKITVLLKDGPSVAIEKAVVTIAEVDLVGSAGKVVLTTTPATTDLLTLATQTMTLVNGAVIPAGPYNQLRYIITGGYIEVGGEVYATPGYAAVPAETVVAGELRLPSEANTGLKVILPEGFEVGSDSVLVVDFDVSTSFHPAGESGAWVMKPTVKATEPKDTGALAVRLSFAPEGGLPAGYSLTDFQAALTPPGASAPSLTPSLVDLGDGSAGVTFPYLVPGDYQVSFVAPDGMTFSTEPAVPQTLTVTAGQTASMDFMLIAAFFAP